MSLIDDLLGKFDLKYDDLSIPEKETLNKWLDDFSQNRLTLEGVREYIASMRDTVEQELTKVDHNTHQDIFLKARLRNYMLLEGFLSSSDKARKALERAMQTLKK